MSKKFFHLISLTVFLMSFGCSAEIQSETALTPAAQLQTAIKNGQLDEVRTLIGNGVNVNQPIDQGIMPLHAAVISNQENIAAVLLQAGAIVDAKDPTTQATSLHLAALYGREGIANLLIQKGADMNATMKLGITPLLVASEFNQAQIVQLLLDKKDKKVPINQADQEGFTALHFAAQKGNTVIARMLLDHGANANLADKTNNATPMAIAIQNNHSEVAELLRQRGGH